MRLTFGLVFVFTALFFIACGETAKSNKAANSTNAAANDANKSANTGNAAVKEEEAPPAVDKSKLATPGDSIEYQFELVKKGDYESLKECCFTDRAKSVLTKEIVDQAKIDSAETNMEELFASVEDGESDGKKTAKVIMKSGGTLTTLIETDGKWLADTIWFK